MCGDSDSIIYVPLLVEGINSTSDNLFVEALILLTVFPFNLEILPAAPNPVASSSEKFKVSPIL